MAQDSPRITPRQPQEGPKTGPKRGQDGSRRAEDGQRHPHMAQVEGSAEYLVIYEVIGTSGRCREEAKKPLGALLEPSWSPLGAVRGD